MYKNSGEVNEHLIGYRSGLVRNIILPAIYRSGCHNEVFECKKHHIPSLSGTTGKNKIFEFKIFFMKKMNCWVVEGKRLFNLGKFNYSQFNYSTELAKNKIFYRLKFQRTPKKSLEHLKISQKSKNLISLVLNKM